MLAGILKTLGPCLSTDLSEVLVKNYGVTPAAARQRVSRGAPEIKRLAHLPFARKARFLYHQDEFASPRYWDCLYQAIFATNGPYARALGAAQARKATPTAHFLAACGAPIAQKKQISAQTVLDRMIGADVLVEHVLPGLGPCVMTKKIYESHEAELEDFASEIRSRLIAEQILLDSVLEWLRRLGMTSYNAARSRSDAMPRIGTFAWDLAGPSYLTSVVSWAKDGKIKPGWVVCDVLLNDQVQLGHVEPLLHKVRSLTALKNIARTMFIFVAQSYEEDAFHELRSAGVVPATPSSLFGQDVADGFRDLINTLTEAAKGVVEPEKFDQLFSTFGKLKGAVGNMRGAFFELLVAEVVRRSAVGQVKLNKICEGEDGSAEVDVYHINEGLEARFIECKGIAPGTFVDDDEVVRWLTVRINRVRHHLRNLRWSGPLPKFELWTSGLLSEAAKRRVDRTREANARQFELHVFEAESLRKQVLAVNDTSLLKSFEQHFLPHEIDATVKATVRERKV